MKKCLMVLVVMMLAFTGCGKQQKEINLDDLANELMESVEFDDELAQIDEQMISKIYGIDNAKKAIVYIGSGATAEEIALFEFESEADSKEGYKKVQERIEKQKEDYASYIPEEVARLEKAVEERCQNYVILCVSSDDSVKSIVKEYTK